MSLQVSAENEQRKKQNQKAEQQLKLEALSKELNQKVYEVEIYENYVKNLQEAIRLISKSTKLSRKSRLTFI